jgi:hypothetical protein
MVSWSRGRVVENVGAKEEDSTRAGGVCAGARGEWAPEEDGGESGGGESNNGEQPRERECTMIVDGELKHFGRQRIDIDGNIFILKHVNIYSS